MSTEYECHDYDDIIDFPHPTSKKHPRMSALARAAQFASFAALQGHDEAVKEKARLTDKKIELDDGAIDLLNERIAIMRDYLKTEAVFTVTYFIPDERKSGGRYETYSGTVRRIDDYERRIVFEDKKEIPMDDILIIESDVFTENSLEV